MPVKRIPASALTPEHFARYPVWEFTNEERPGDDTVVRPLAKLPVTDLGNRLVGCRVRLADGDFLWAMLGNVHLKDAISTEHFLTASLWTGQEWFHLARYFDVDRGRRGPRALARTLGRRIAEIFPIEYDLTKVAVGRRAIVRGAIPARPLNRLSRKAIIKLAVSRATR